MIQEPEPTPANDPSPAPAARIGWVILLALPLLAALVWAYWPTLAAMARKWSTEPQYSHGYLVPLFAVALLWLKRKDLDVSETAPNWWGLLLLLAGIALRICGAYFSVDFLDSISLVPCLAGLVLLLGGWRILLWAAPAIAFLFFMVPLPYRVETSLQYPLRRIGTESSVYVMQTLGLPALAEGNVIVLDESRIGVAEACSGMRMLMIFFALTTAVAMLSKRPLWERLVIVFSAVPIALTTNVIRITTTGVLYWKDYSDLAEVVFHDVAGWLMMPFALLLLWLEFWLLTRLFIVEVDRPVQVGLGQSES